MKWIYTHQHCWNYVFIDQHSGQFRTKNNPKIFLGLAINLFIPKIWKLILLTRDTKTFVAYSWEFGVLSKDQFLVDDFLTSLCISIWHLNKIVTRIYFLVTQESKGLIFNSSWGLRIFSFFPMLVTRQKNIFLYFHTELKTYHLF